MCVIEPVAIDDMSSGGMATVLADNDGEEASTGSVPDDKHVAVEVSY